MDPLWWMIRLHSRGRSTKKGGNTVQLIYKALLILCVVSLAILVPALFVAATWLQVKEGKNNENP